MKPYYPFRNIGGIVTLLLVTAITCNSIAQNSNNTTILPSAVSSAASSGSRGNPSASLRGAGMQFTQNKGQVVDMRQQTRSDILFKGDGGGADVYLRKTGLSYVVSNLPDVMHEVNEQVEELEESGEINSSNAERKRLEVMNKQILKVHRIDIDFLNCLSAEASAQADNPTAEINVADRVEGLSNYYYAHCPAGITDVNSYNEITFKNIYNKIDIKYYGGKEHGLKYDIVVNPGGNPDDIKLKYSGADDLIIKNGELRIKNSVGEMTEQLPKVYQNVNGEIVDVETEYRLEYLSNNDVIVHFSFSTFNSSFPLVVDPWLSYFGGSSVDAGVSVTTDPSGNVLFTGVVQSVNFPVSAGAYQAIYGGQVVIAAYHDAEGDAFIVKMDANGNRLWATYYGGTSNEHGCGITTDAAGNVLIAGNTISTNFPVSAACHQPVYGGNSLQDGDAFLLKLDAAGVRLWATFYGGTSGDYGYDVATDGSNIYFYGNTLSPNAISTGGSFQAANNGLADVFVTKFSPTGNRLWGTYVGGAQWDVCGGVAYDNISGNIYIAGSSASTNFPVLAGAQMAFGGSRDAFLVKFSPAGVRLWSTYYGGNNEEIGTCIAVDNIGNIVLGGRTQSAGSIATIGAYQSVFGGGMDGFIAKFNNAGSLLWGTYFGGNLNEWFYGGIAVDGNNNIYAYGEWEDSNSGNYPISSCAYQTNFGGGWVSQWVEDQFIARFDANGWQRCITYIGGTGEDDLDYGYALYGGGISGGAITVNGNWLYITGYTDGGYPVTGGAFQTTYAGSGTQAAAYQTAGDAFIDQLCINICEAKLLSPDFTSSTATVCANSNAPIRFTPTVNTSCDTITQGYKFLWTFTGGTPATSTAINPSVIFSGAGAHTVQLTVTTPCKTETVTKSAYITVNNCSFTANVTGANVLCSGQTNGSAIATPIGGTAPFSFLWSNGATSQTITGLAAGTYTVTITDAAPATTVLSITITAPLVLSATTSQISPTNCNSSNGVASVNPSGGTGTYTYNWSNGATVKTAFNLAVGTYTVTVKDANNCSVSKTVNITLPSPMSLAMSSTATTCNNANGSASVVVTGSSGVLSYSWSPVGQTFSSISQVLSGTYTVFVTDVVNGCTKTATVNVAASAGPTATFTQSPTGTVCLGTNVTFTNTGSTGTYNWLVSPANVSGSTVNFSYTFLSTGSYTISHTVTSGGCSKQETSSVNVINCTSGPSVTATGSSVCPGSCGTVTASGTGGTSPYTYTWSNGATTQNINPCPASTTTYTVTIRDTGGGTSTSTTVVTVNPAISVTASMSNISCNGNSDGSGTATAGSGTPAYTYNWSNLASGSSVSGLSAGSYTVTVTDIKGCTATSTVAIASPPALIGQFTKGTASCIGCGCKEWLMVNATGGTSPYSYTWPDGYGNRYKNRLCPGAYNVNIVDKNGCSINVSLTTP